MFTLTAWRTPAPVSGTSVVNRRTWQLRDRMVLFGLSIGVFIRRPPVWIFLFHHHSLCCCCCFLLPALILHPVTRTQKRVCFTFQTTRLRRSSLSACCLAEMEPDWNVSCISDKSRKSFCNSFTAVTLNTTDLIRLHKLNTSVCPKVLSSSTHTDQP